MSQELHVLPLPPTLMNALHQSMSVTSSPSFSTWPSAWSSQTCRSTTHEGPTNSGQRCWWLSQTYS